MRPRVPLRYAALVTLLALAGCAAPANREPTASATPEPTPSATVRPTGSATPAPEVTLIGAGDIAACETQDDEATAALVEELLASAGGEARVFTAGDLVYPDGALENYQRCYGPSWGRFLDRTLAVPGNHDYYRGSLDGYFSYFGAAAGEDPLGRYEVEIGSWQVLVLNSTCDAVGGCGAGSEQERWLRERLASAPTECTLALWHNPRYSSGHHGSYPGTDALWDALVEDGAELLITGHDHSYERFAPMDAEDALDPETGVRQFVVGTGGATLRSFNATLPNSEARAVVHGVLVLTLGDGAYTWEFVPTTPGAFADSGSGRCH
jgi:calcineurin-like phosphoesterase family protein